MPAYLSQHVVRLANYYVVLRLESEVFEAISRQLEGLARQPHKTQLGDFMTAILFIELSEPTKANGDKQQVNAISAMHED